MERVGLQSDGELDAGGEGLPELPPGRHDVGDDDGAAIGGGDAEGERLAGEPCERLPVGALVLGHGHLVRGATPFTHTAFTDPLPATLVMSTSTK